ncbi:hypothetical protein KY284_032889 [Solanum tuberosum]|nr:hypothetical protein KY284_032889 [Solanum tuberosum]
MFSIGIKSWWQHSENHATYELQDAHEFFISMLNKIHDKDGKASLPIKDARFPISKFWRVLSFGINFIDKRKSD